MTKNKIIPLLLLLPISLLIGFLEYSARRESPYASGLLMTHAILSIALIFIWFRRDAAARGYKTSWLLKLTVIGLTVFALPYYFFRSRGFIGGIGTVMLSLLLFVSAMLVYRAGAWLA